MPPVTLLTAGLAMTATAIVLVVLAIGGRSARPARMVDAGLDAIQSQYARSAVVAARNEGVTLPLLLPRLRWLAAAVSPRRLTASLGHRLDLAGNPGGWPADKVLALKGLGLLAGATAGVVLGFGSFLAMLPYTLIGGAVGFLLPDVLIYNMGDKRQKVIRDALPDTLDMLTVCVEAGLGFDAALSQVGNNTKGPLAEECLRMLQEMQLGKSRLQALRGLSERTTIPELRAFASALVQAAELGIPIGQVLRGQAKEMRTKQRQLAEEKAQKLPVKILFPMMFCIFPALFIVVLGPAAISMLATLSQ
jgi:tight adherence protein C